MTRIRIALLAIVAASALALAGAVLADGEGASAKGSDVHLTVHNVFGLQTLELNPFDFNAKIASDGSAKGHYSYREVDDGVPFTASGPVTCLTVIGHDAWIGGTITESNDPTVIGSGSWWHVTDNGDGRKAPPSITTFLGIGTLAQTQAFCDTYPPYKHPFPIDGGHIEVHATHNK